MRAKHEICRQPVTTYAALAEAYTRHGPWPGVRTLNGTWELSRERADKPGWQSDKGGSALAFDVRFGAKPRLTIVYEQSYEAFGDATLTMAGPRSRERLVLPGRDASLESNATQATTLVVQVGGDTESGRRAWNVPPFGNATVVLTNLGHDADRRRVKLRRVSGC